MKIVDKVEVKSIFNWNGNVFIVIIDVCMYIYGDFLK